MLATAALAALASACGPGRAARSGAGAGLVTTPWSVRYDVSIRSAESWTLDVRATFEGGVERGRIAFPPAVSDVVVVGGDGRERRPEQQGRAFLLGCASTCAVRYSFGLRAAAELTNDAVSVAVRGGEDIVAPASVWLLRPEPVDARAKVTLHVNTAHPAGSGEPLRFTSPFPRDAATGDHLLVARDLSAVGYTLFGRFTERRVAATGGHLDVAVLGGARAADDAAIERWVSATARALDTVYGRFPVERVLVAIVPVPGDEVVFGRTVPAGGPSILLLAGQEMDADDLHADWVLAHELFHLGVPSMPDGAWLDEGLATYYEPVLRTRAGLVSETATWTELWVNLPDGAVTAAQPSLSRAHDHDRVYYGGAAFALAADVEIRRRTGGARSLDDGLRRALTEGARATEVWSVSDFIAAIDRGAGVPVARELLERVAEPRPACEAPAPGQQLDLAKCAPDDAAAIAGLLDALGVRRAEYGGLRLDDTAALARIRRTITGVDEAVAAAASARPGDAAKSPAGGPGAASKHEAAGVEKP